MQRMRGLALIAVLWLVAALSIIVAGLLQSVRTEARLGTQLQDVALASASGEAAMQLALQSLLAAGKPLDRLADVNMPWMDQSIAVRIMPLNGYIDLNAAPPSCLRRCSRPPPGCLWIGLMRLRRRRCASALSPAPMARRPASRPWKT